MAGELSAVVHGLVFACLSAAGVVAVIAPWLIGHIYHLRSDSPPPLSHRLKASLLAGLCALVAMAAAVGAAWLLLGRGLLEPSTDRGLALLGVLLAAGLIGVRLYNWRALPGFTPSRYRGLWLVGLLIVLALASAAGGGLYTAQHIRIRSQREAEAAGLRRIAGALRQYGRRQGNYPQRLGQLAEAGHLPAEALRSVQANAGGEPQTQPFGNVACDWYYFTLPVGAPGELMWVWQSPALWRNQGALVLYHSGKVQWLEPARLVDELMCTVAWRDEVAPRMHYRQMLRRHEAATQTAGRPATQPATRSARP